MSCQGAFSHAHCAHAVVHPAGPQSPLSDLEAPPFAQQDARKRNSNVPAVQARTQKVLREYGAPSLNIRQIRLCMIAERSCCSGIRPRTSASDLMGYYYLVSSTSKIGLLLSVHSKYVQMWNKVCISALSMTRTESRGTNG